MSDIFREVDEEVRVQKLEAFWKKYSALIIFAVILLISAVGGWRYYQYREANASAASAARFEEALELSRQGKTPEAEKALTLLGADGAAGYKLLARFRAAAELSQGDAAQAAKAYDSLAADLTIGPILQDLAKLRAASLLVDIIPAEDLSIRLSALAQPGQVWRNSARELLGLSRYKSGDLKAASGFFEQIALDPETPEALRQRAQIMLALVRGGAVPVK